jgi:hypothetical protein
MPSADVVDWAVAFAAAVLVLYRRQQSPGSRSGRKDPVEE